MGFADFVITKNINPNGQDVLHIKPHHISASLNALRFIDGDTNQIVYYLPSLNVSGYGKTLEQSMEMVKFSIEEYFSYLLSLSTKKREEKLRGFGWHTNKIRNKRFSKAFVNDAGELNGFAVEGQVEHLTLETA